MRNLVISSLVRGVSEESGKLAIFPTGAQAAIAALVHAPDGTQVATGVRDGLYWWPMLPYGPMTQSLNPDTTTGIGPTSVPRGKADAVVFDQKEQKRRGFVRAA